MNILNSISSEYVTIGIISVLFQTANRNTPINSLSFFHYISPARFFLKSLHSCHYMNSRTHFESEFLYRLNPLFPLFLQKLHRILKSLFPAFVTRLRMLPLHPEKLCSQWLCRTEIMTGCSVMQMPVRIGKVLFLKPLHYLFADILRRKQYITACT